MTDPADIDALNSETNTTLWTRKATKVIADQQAEINRLKSDLEKHRIWHLETDEKLKDLATGADK